MSFPSYAKNAAHRLLKNPVTAMSLTTIGMFAVERHVMPKKSGKLYETAFWDNMVYTPVIGPLGGMFLRTAALSPHPVQSALFFLAFSASMAGGLNYCFGPKHKSDEKDAEKSISVPPKLY